MWFFFFFYSTHDNEFYSLWADLKMDKDHISIQDQSEVFIGIQFFSEVNLIHSHSLREPWCKMS